jgi:prepilin-type N-terminal cleavage/methylation domain-containing protein
MCSKKEQSMLGKLKDNKGFSLLELLVVLLILGIMAQMTSIFVLDLKTRSSDLMAISDGRNLMTIIRDNFVNLEDVDYTQTNGSGIGVRTVGGVNRQPVFSLSSGVGFRIEAGSQSDGTAENGYFEAYLYHTGGTSDTTVSGKREFYYLADEAFDAYTIATF